MWRRDVRPTGRQTQVKSNGECRGCVPELAGRSIVSTQAAVPRLRWAGEPRQTEHSAARTGILSSRWRGLWTHLREISFSDGAKHPAIDVTDAAAETLHHPAAAARVARWLRLASRRLAGVGELRLRIAPRWRRRFVRAGELELPVRVSISHFGLQPWVPAAGAFAALRVLSIACFDFQKLDLEARS
ncbi:hypothetical protein C2845_PM06G28010 [Panicum miliaceum]|uniref:Uncharacterized protein n=1 Tax=Panicum miliaceum TaxID=4540 RepID=A0A3L6RCN4_PANMI|nr:hypothetical protein C2845_PM06G28010 [Panicum miliaceum]